MSSFAVDYFAGNSREIDIVIGCQETPIAWETVFGWILVDGTSTGDPCKTSLTMMVTDPDKKIIRKFWELDAMGICDDTESPPLPTTFTLRTISIFCVIQMGDT